MASELPFDSVELDRSESEPAFHVDVDGFEGPLDLLIELARRQKVDLHKISILALAEQYLAFIDAARQMRLELAADYLVMAAYLAYLKSRLLIPDPPHDDQPAAAGLAADLAARMRRLAAMRRAGEDLMDRPRLGRDVFACGQPEALEGTNRVVWDATLFDLLSAYARQRQKHALSRVTLRQRVVWSLAEASEVLERLAGTAVDWTAMDACLEEYLAPVETRRTVRASTFSAALELVRGGRLQLRQDGAFRPLFVRGAPSPRPVAQGA